MNYLSKLLSITFLILILTSSVWGQSKGLITIRTQSSELVFKVGDNKKLYQCYFGQSLKSTDLEGILETVADAYPGFGTSYINVAAMRVVHWDGNTSTELLYIGHTEQKLPGDVTLTTIETKDAYFPFKVKLCFKAYEKENVIEQWVEITHSEKKDIILYDYSSSHLSFSGPSYYLTQFSGNWADEMNMAEVPLTRG